MYLVLLYWIGDVHGLRALGMVDFRGVREGEGVCGLDWEGGWIGYIS